MDLLKRYFDLQQQIFDHFHYTEDWVVIPLDDATNKYWFYVQNDSGRGIVCWSDDPWTIESAEAGDEVYSGHIYTQRFLPKYVYRTEEYTMISVDTQVDGNKFLMVFSNDRECHDRDIKVAYLDAWGDCDVTEDDIDKIETPAADAADA
jgi:hypothetical protein